MRACAGTWIAHGSGGADRETVDATDSVRVPPDAPGYRLRRVWLSEVEEAGYYYGFANEGLWPLCHHAHTRPTFRAPDWRSLRDGQPALRRRGRAGGADAQPARPCAGLPLRPCSPASSASACPRRPSSPSGTSRGPTLKRSASVRGASRSWRACSAPPFSGSTRSSTATTSSTASTATSRRASTARPSPFPTEARRPRCIATRSRSSGRPRPWPASRRWPNAVRTSGARSGCPRTCSSASG